MLEIFIILTLASDDATKDKQKYNREKLQYIVKTIKKRLRFQRQKDVLYRKTLAHCKDKQMYDGRKSHHHYS